jgi:glycosyltransferase involved in cell wall biosynthesis
VNLDQIAFGWAADSGFGWGVIGVNWMLYWPGVALSAMPDLAAELPPADDRVVRLANRLRQSKGFQRGLGAAACDFPCFVALGNDFESKPGASHYPLRGTPTIAMPVFEDLAMAAQHVDRLKGYSLVIAPSAWNRDWLLEHGIPARLCHQGYDPVLFHPGVRQRRDDGRFRVFSGGKAEYRKGQDIVLQAFARFAERHDDAVLVASWGSPWPGMAKSFADCAIGPPPGAELGLPNYRAWAQKCGIKPHQIEIVSPLPNWRMAEVYGGVDCAIFPNRAEGGTNLVAMECMACGVPTYIRASTGQADLVNGPLSTCIDEDMIDVVWAAMEGLYKGCEQKPLAPKWAWPARMAELTDILRDV